MNFFLKKLSRKEALETDLELYNGPSWLSMLRPISPTQQNYVQSLQSCVQPELLIAHPYVWYFGDLSGGQVLAKKLQTYNELPEGQGVALHPFDRIEDRDMFKRLFRMRLNQVEVDEDLYRQLIQESCRALAMTIDMFREFDDGLKGPTSTPLPAPTPTPATSAKDTPMTCPFANNGMEDLHVDANKGFANNAPIASKDSSFAATGSIKSHLTIAFTEWDRLSAIPLVSHLTDFGRWFLRSLM